MNEEIEKLESLINKANKIVFFTGAGVSTLSGLKDFRSSDGLYNEKEKYPPESILSHDFFYNNTEYFYKFYKKNLNSLKYSPNIIHKTIKKLQDSGKDVSVVTQNIDGFDKEAGTKNVYEIHGTIMENYCTKCGKKYDAEYVFNYDGVPKCTCGGLIKPNVVLYGEALNDEIVYKAIKKIEEANLLIICGTSLAVYPAAAFINYFNGESVVLINRDATPKDNMCKIVIHDDLGKVFENINKDLNI